MAVIFVPDGEHHETGHEVRTMERSVKRVVRWATEAGIGKVSFYERDGELIFLGSIKRCG